jgi:hypothetical protein
MYQDEYYRSENYLSHFYIKPYPLVFLEEQLIQTKNDKLLKRVTSALDYIRKYFKKIIERKLGREIKIPESIKIVTCKIPIKLINGIAGIKFAKPLAAVPVYKPSIIFCDDGLEGLAEDELTHWILPHELLHLNGIEDEEFIERLLVKIYDDLGFKEISEKIRKKSAYLNSVIT